ncbi:MAG: glycosyltransferase [Acidobacteriaceae bacterium]|nr:glycosyltransferase [Acidobacteriaceae bacterium]
MILALIVLSFAALPALVFALNFGLFRRAPGGTNSVRTSISVLIPARNEEKSIEGAVRSVLASEHVELEVVVLDDGSEDGTASVVSRMSRQDPRVRLVQGRPLPEGWCGKQYACFQLGAHARFDVLCFIDSDVRLAPDCLWRMAELLRESGSALVSGFPRQETATFAEWLVLPLIHFILLGFLPLDRMRKSSNPAFSAGCGQLIMTVRDAYVRSGGHASIRTSLHDGISLPRGFRAAGLRTDIFDASDVATCRMFQNAAEVWFGLSRNATEGMAAPSRILAFTVLLFFGQLLPLPLMLFSAAAGKTLAITMIYAAAASAGYAVRFVCALRYRQPVRSAVLHPLGILVLLGIQWFAFIRHLLRRPASWKGRAYPAGITG